MKEWIKISGLLCVFGFIREIRPSEPFITEFILGPWRNITEDQVNREVYPVGTYSYLAQLVIVFLITDYLRYKPLIFVIGLSGILTWSLLIWTTSLLWLQIMEFVYGTYMASEVAYFTYIYAKVDKKYYTKVTSHTRAAMLIGKLFAGTLAQVTIYFQWLNYKDLNYITLAAQICATFWTFLLPNVTTSLYFHRNDMSIDNTNNYANGISSQQLQVNKISPFHLLISHFKNAYTNPNVIKWSIWYALALCEYLLVFSYIQILWKSINEDSKTVWNGAVDAILTLVGAIFALLAGYIKDDCLKFKNSNLLILSVLSIVEGGAILLSSWTTNIYISYLGYIIYGSLYAFTITVTSAEVAKHLEEDSFGLVFGINTVVALLLQTIITVVVISETGFGLNITNQYLVFSYSLIAIGIFTTIWIGIHRIICCNKSETYIKDNNVNKIY